jgi:glyoxylase-like metal-dependent hydrolase (beta-lactamase superfamily II)
LIGIEKEMMMAISRLKNNGSIHTIDLRFMSMPGAIAVYLIPHVHGAILIETGPGSTIPALQAGLKSYGLEARDVTDVLLTHIHLDHAGAAGWLARQGALIHVHSAGAPHLLDPEKLLASAARIYGDKMQTLWGEFLPVPADRLSVLHDWEVLEIEGVQIQALDTPGHANHHFAYLVGDVCFTGDIGGVRLAGPRHLRLPMPPPEFHLESWRSSIKRLLDEYSRGSFSRLAPTHFGIFSDPAWHLAALQEALDEVEAWMLAVLPADPPLEQLNEQFLAWMEKHSLQQGFEPEILKVYELANPSWMSSFGIQRYWRKYRNGSG